MVFHRKGLQQPWAVFITIGLFVAVNCKIAKDEEKTGANSVVDVNADLEPKAVSARAFMSAIFGTGKKKPKPGAAETTVVMGPPQPPPPPQGYGQGPPGYGQGPPQGPPGYGQGPPQGPPGYGQGPPQGPPGYGQQEPPGGPPGGSDQSTAAKQALQAYLMQRLQQQKQMQAAGGGGGDAGGGQNPYGQQPPNSYGQSPGEYNPGQAPYPGQSYGGNPGEAQDPYAEHQSGQEKNLPYPGMG